MSKWRLKVALLTATSTLSALLLGGCLSGDWAGRIYQLVAIGNLFD